MTHAGPIPKDLHFDLYRWPFRSRDLHGAALEAAVSELIAPREDLAGSISYKRYITGVVVADLLVDCQQQEVQA